MKRWLFVLLPWLMFLNGCSTLHGIVNVLGTCEIPAQYDYTAEGPADLMPGISLQALVTAEAGVRHDLKTLADDYNGLHDYVKGCG